MVFARIFFFLTLPLAGYFYLFPGAPQTVRRATILSANPQSYWAANKDLQGAAAMTSLHYRAWGRLPTDFAAFLREQRRLLGRMDPAPEADVWGTPYVLVEHSDSYEIVSCGVDRDCERAVDNLIERVRKVKPAANGEPVGIKPEDLEKTVKQVLQ